MPLNSSESSVVYIGVGGNQPGTMDAILTARRIISVKMAPLTWASLYVTDPQMDINQDIFLNTVFKGIWHKDPFELLLFLQSIETALGRKRDPHRPKGPRILDLDILLFGSSQMNTPDLILPHPGICERRFVLEPLLELSPGLSAPQSSQPYADALKAVSFQGVYRRNKNW